MNPNPNIAWKQIRHTFRPEALIQPGMPFVAEINRELDGLIAADRGRHSESRLIEKFIYKKVQYVTDYQNWGNAEYWPTAEEVWARRREDCDGRAILAATVLRSRGHPSAKLVVGLQHMWVQYNENDRDPSKPAKTVALLSPERDVRLPMNGNPDARHFLSLAESFFRPTALRETSAGLFAEIPGIRKGILIALLLLLCYHPCRNWLGALGVLATGLAAACLLADWSGPRSSDLELTAGVALFGAALFGALLMHRFGPALPRRTQRT